jgi:hypothetical protein
MQAGFQPFRLGAGILSAGKEMAPFWRGAEGRVLALSVIGPNGPQVPIKQPIGGSVIHKTRERDVMDGGDLAAIHDVRTLRSDGDKPLGETAGGSRKGRMNRCFGLRANNRAAENLFPAAEDFCDEILADLFFALGVSISETRGHPAAGLVVSISDLA